MSNQENFNSEADKLTDKHGVAAYIGCTIRTVDNHMRGGRIPYLKIGRTVRFRLSDVQSYLDETCRVVRRTQQ